MSFKIGQKVVCVDGGSWNSSYVSRPIKKPIEAHIYTIRWIGYVDSDLCVLLQEIVNDHYYWCAGTRYAEPTFRIKRFRPIDYSFGEETAERIEKELIPETVEI
jgi:hypothetical protein